MLSAKRRAFVEEYLRCWNATEAARRAGYSARSANPTGSRLLANDSVKACIEQRLKEKAMSADEVLQRLGEHARAPYAPYITDRGTVDLAGLLAAGLGHLIKSTKQDRWGAVTIEFYDAQSALVHLGRHHGLFTDTMAVKGVEDAPGVKIEGGDDHTADILRVLAEAGVFVTGAEKGADAAH